ncbi:MAG: hypothetical protein WD426_16270 [Anditalea sp.]
MNFRPFLLLIWSFHLSILAYGQEEFLVGMARESLQPGDEAFSLTLAGYGAPRAGRFTLNWERKDSIGHLTLAPASGDFYAVGENGEMSKANGDAWPLKWSPTGKAMSAKSMTSENNIIFLLDAAGDIYSRSGPDQKFSLEYQGNNGLKEIVFFKEELYGLMDNGEIIKTKGKSEKWKWESVALLPGAVSFTLHHQSIYATTGTDTLWKTDATNTAAGWIKAGYSNGFIQDVQIKKLLGANDKLFAIDAQGILFEATKNYGKEQDELFASALAIQKKNQTVVIICLDLCGFDYSLIDEVKQTLLRNRGLPASSILVNASHTHFAPVTQSWATWAPHNQTPDINYMNKVVKPAILKAAGKALDNMEPSFISFGRGHTQIGRNRSNEGKDSPYDDAVDVIKVENRNRDQEFLMVLAGCHPVAGTSGLDNFTISSNYPGYMRHVLEKTRKNTTSLFMQGCGGDINPRDSQPEMTGMKLATDVLQVLNHDMKRLSGNISFFLDTLSVPSSPWSPKTIEAFKHENQKQKGNLDAEKNVRWSDLMLKHHEQGTMPNQMPIYLQTINIGDWKLVGLSREVVTEYSLGIKQIWPDQQVSVAGYCNDVSSYLPTERHIRTGVYEGYNSFLWYAQPSAFPENIYDRVIDQVKTSNY